MYAELAAVDRYHNQDRLYIREEPSSSSVDEPSSDLAPTDRIDVAAQRQDFLHQQSTISPAKSIDTFS